MRPIQNAALIQQLQWRYATKKFDPARKISDEDWETLEEALVLTPSSFGLQPWKFFVVSNPALREKLLPVSWGQRQVIDASHLVVFAIRKNLGTADLDHYLRRMAEVRGIEVASLDPFRKVVAGFLSRDPSEFNVNEWATPCLVPSGGPQLVRGAEIARARTVGHAPRARGQGTRSLGRGFDAIAITRVVP